LPITGVEEAERVEGVSVFHAGTKREAGKLVTAGGRVLGVTAVGDDL
jgi:phosphoribosylamine--glycine ligase